MRIGETNAVFGMADLSDTSQHTVLIYTFSTVQHPGLSLTQSDSHNSVDESAHVRVSASLSRFFGSHLQPTWLRSPLDVRIEHCQPAGICRIICYLRRPLNQCPIYAGGPDVLFAPPQRVSSKRLDEAQRVMKTRTSKSTPHRSRPCAGCTPDCGVRTDSRKLGQTA
jgi:hypothetical protein